MSQHPYSFQFVRLENEDAPRFRLLVWYVDGSPLAHSDDFDFDEYSEALSVAEQLLACPDILRVKVQEISSQNVIWERAAK